MSEPAFDSDHAEILFPEGIIGVPRARRFHLLEREDSPIRYLSSLDIQGFSLPVVDPFLADPAYRPKLGSRITEALGSNGKDTILMLAITHVTADGARANLRAPLVINVNSQRAVQVILDDAGYSLAAPVELEARTVEAE